MVQSPVDFSALVADARKQKKEAFAELLSPYHDRLNTMAQQLIGPMLQPHIDAADLLQELKLILWMGISSGAYAVATPGKLLALARTILHGCVSRHWRAVKRMHMNVTVEGKLDVTRTDIPVLASRTEPDPGSAIDHAESVRNILGQLDVEDRRLVEMRMQGHSTAEVARRLGVDAGCLRVRLSRLRARLSHFLAAAEPS